MSASNSRSAGPTWQAECEEALLGTVMTYPEEGVPMALKCGIRPEWFAEARNQLVWLAVISCWKRAAESVELPLLKSEMAKIAGAPKSEYEGVSVSALELSGMLDKAASTASVPEFVNEVREAWVGRSLRGCFARASRRLDSSAPSDVAQALVTDVLHVIGDADTEKGLGFCDAVDTSVAKMEEAHRIYMEERRRDYVDGVRLPWWPLTTAYYGLPVGLNIIAARPSVGKTSFVLECVKYWHSIGLKVGINSLDMAEVPLVDRLVSAVARVSLGKARFGYTGGRDMQRIRDAAKNIKTWACALRVEEDVDRLAAWARVQKASGGLDVLVVDFLQLMTYEGAARDPDESRIARISKTLKRLGNTLKIPVVALSQLNRRCEEDGGREPTASDLRGSGALEQDATTIAMLHRQADVLDMWDMEKIAGTATSTPFKLAGGDLHLTNSIDAVELILAKNQNGKTGRVPFVVWKNYFTWMLGAFERPVEWVTVGTGAVAKNGKKKRDTHNQYAAVHSDGRNPEFERRLAEHGVLLPEVLPPEPQLEQGEFEEPDRAESAPRAITQRALASPLSPDYAPREVTPVETDDFDDDDDTESLI